MADAKKIDPFDVEALEKSLNDSATRVSTIWVSFLLFGLYLVTAAGTVSHRQLFLKDSIKLPVLNIEMPFLGFWLLAPTLFVIFHAYVLIQVLLLARTSAAYNEAVDRKIANDTYRSHVRQRLANTLFAQIFAGSPRERSGPLGLVLRLMAWTTLAIAPFFILLTFELKFLAYHSQFVTWVHRLLIAIDLFALFLLWPAALDPRRNIGSWSVRQYLINIVVVVAWTCLCILIISFPGEPHALWLVQNSNAGTIYSNIKIIETGACGWSRVAWLLPSNFDRLYLPRESFVEDDKLAKFDVANKQRALKPYQGERSHSFRYRNLNCGNFEGADLRRTDFTSARLIGANLKEAGLHGGLLARARLHGASLDRAQLPDSSLESAQLRGSSLSNTQLQRAFLQESHLEGVALEEAQLEGASLDRAQLQGASLYGAALQGASLRGAALQDASLRNAKLQGAVLDNAHLEGASLSGAQLQGASLDDAHLQGASFESAQLQGASLEDAHLSGASFERANLQGASLEDAYLQGASFESASLQGASLVDAHLQGAIIRDAQLQGASLRGANLAHALLSDVYVWRATNPKCTGAQITEYKSDAVVEIETPTTQPAAATFSNISRFIERSVVGLPAGSLKEAATSRMRSNLVIDTAKKASTAAINDSWSRCKQESAKVQQAEFEKQRLIFLRNLVCRPEQDLGLVKGVIRNWIGDIRDKYNISTRLALGVLGEDGKECAATKRLSQEAINQLREVVALPQ